MCMFQPNRSEIFEFSNREETLISNSSTGNSKRGIDVLHDPTLNKSTGYTEKLKA